MLDAMAKRPLAPRSQIAYDKILQRAFGSLEPPYGRFVSEVHAWPESQRAMLRAAISRRLTDQGVDPTSVVKAIPSVWAPRNAVKTPTEVEAQAYEKTAFTLRAGKRAFALLPLAMGLRSEEILTLGRPDVTRGANTGELLVMRKGGKKQALPCSHATDLLVELLEQHAALGRKRLEDPQGDFRKPTAWGLAGEILSSKSYLTRYHLFRDLIEATGLAAGVTGLRPHLLRHAFATRMDRDGASVPMIQAWLGHRNIATTLRYVHPDTKEGAKFVRPFKL